jgi:uncharacterized protein (TIGR02001 family)
MPRSLRRLRAHRIAGLAVLWLGLAGPALAQVSGSATLVSDYRYRGRSLSDGEPAATLSVNYDDPSGAYAAASVVGPDTRQGGVQLLGYIVNAGYVAQAPQGAAWDVGAIDYHLATYQTAQRTVDFTEVYAGLVTRYASFHLYYSPDYAHLGARTLYADMDATFRPAPTLRLFGHFGALASVGGADLDKEQFDLKFGIARQIWDGELSLAWTHLAPAATFAGGDHQSRDALVLGAAYFF